MSMYYESREKVCENCNDVATVRIHLRLTHLDLCETCVHKLDDLIEQLKHQWRYERGKGE